MLIETLTLGQILAVAISAISVIILYQYIGRDHLGADENSYWNNLRRAVLSAGDSTVRQKTKFALTNPAYSEGKVCTTDKTSKEFAHLLKRHGYVQCILSGLKYRPPDASPTDEFIDFEAGSMAYRESKSDFVPDFLALRQIHVFWFENEDGSITIYAHDEYSSLNPLVAWFHYIGKSSNYENGIRAVERILAE